MSDKEPSQQPTPAKTPKKSQEPSDSDQEDPGYQSGRSRSQSRRRRRQNQRQRSQQQQQQQQQDGGGGGGAQAQSMAKIEEEQGQDVEEEEMQPFERIGMLELDVILDHLNLLRSSASQQPSVLPRFTVFLFMLAFRFGDFLPPFIEGYWAFCDPVHLHTSPSDPSSCLILLPIAITHSSPQDPHQNPWTAP